MNWFGRGGGGGGGDAGGNNNNNNNNNESDQSYSSDEGSRSYYSGESDSRSYSGGEYSPEEAEPEAPQYDDSERDVSDQQMVNEIRSLLGVGTQPEVLYAMFPPEVVDRVLQQQDNEGTQQREGRRSQHSRGSYDNSSGGDSRSYYSSEDSRSRRSSPSSSDDSDGLVCRDTPAVRRSQRSSGGSWFSGGDSIGGGSQGSRRSSRSGGNDGGSSQGSGGGSRRSWSSRGSGGSRGSQGSQPSRGGGGGSSQGSRRSWRSRGSYESERRHSDDLSQGKYSDNGSRGYSDDSRGMHSGGSGGSRFSGDSQQGENQSPTGDGSQRQPGDTLRRISGGSHPIPEEDDKGSGQDMGSQGSEEYDDSYRSGEGSYSGSEGSRKSYYSEGGGSGSVGSQGSQGKHDTYRSGERSFSGSEGSRKSYYSEGEISGGAGSQGPQGPEESKQTGGGSFSGSEGSRRSYYSEGGGGGSVGSQGSYRKNDSYRSGEGSFSGSKGSRGSYYSEGGGSGGIDSQGSQGYEESKKAGEESFSGSEGSRGSYYSEGEGGGAGSVGSQGSQREHDSYRSGEGSFSGSEGSRRSYYSEGGGSGGVGSQGSHGKHGSHRSGDGSYSGSEGSRRSYYSEGGDSGGVDSQASQAYEKSKQAVDGSFSGSEGSRKSYYSEGGGSGGVGSEGSHGNHDSHRSGDRSFSGSEGSRRSHYSKGGDSGGSKGARPASPEGSLEGQSRHSSEGSHSHYSDDRSRGSRRSYRTDEGSYYSGGSGSYVSGSSEDSEWIQTREDINRLLQVGTDRSVVEEMFSPEDVERALEDNKRHQESENNSDGIGSHGDYQDEEGSMNSASHSKESISDKETTPDNSGSGALRSSDGPTVEMEKPSKGGQETEVQATDDHSGSAPEASSRGGHDDSSGDLSRSSYYSGDSASLQEGDIGSSGDLSRVSASSSAQKNEHIDSSGALSGPSGHSMKSKEGERGSDDSSFYEDNSDDLSRSSGHSAEVKSATSEDGGEGSESQSMHSRDKQESADVDNDDERHKSDSSDHNEGEPKGNSGGDLHHHENASVPRESKQESSLHASEGSHSGSYYSSESEKSAAHRQSEADEGSVDRSMASGHESEGSYSGSYFSEGEKSEALRQDEADEGSVDGGMALVQESEGSHSGSGSEKKADEGSVDGSMASAHESEGSHSGSHFSDGEKSEALRQDEADEGSVDGSMASAHESEGSHSGSYFSDGEKSEALRQDEADERSVDGSRASGHESEGSHSGSYFSGSEKSEVLQQDKADEGSVDGSMASAHASEGSHSMMDEADLSPEDKQLRSIEAQDEKNEPLQHDVGDDRSVDQSMASSYGSEGSHSGSYFSGSEKSEVLRQDKADERSVDGSVESAHESEGSHSGSYFSGSGDHEPVGQDEADEGSVDQSLASAHESEMLDKDDLPPQDSQLKSVQSEDEHSQGLAKQEFKDGESSVHESEGSFSGSYYSGSEDGAGNEPAHNQLKAVEDEGEPTLREVTDNQSDRSDGSGLDKETQHDMSGQGSIDGGVAHESEGSVSDSSYYSGEDSTRRSARSSSDDSDGLVCRDTTIRRSQRSSGSESSRDRDSSEYGSKSSRSWDASRESAHESEASFSQSNLSEGDQSAGMTSSDGMSSHVDSFAMDSGHPQGSSVQPPPSKAAILHPQERDESGEDRSSPEASIAENESFESSSDGTSHMDSFAVDSEQMPISSNSAPSSSSNVDSFAADSEQMPLSSNSVPSSNMDSFAVDSYNVNLSSNSAPSNIDDSFAVDSDAPDSLSNMDSFAGESEHPLESHHSALETSSNMGSFAVESSSNMGSFAVESEHAQPVHAQSPKASKEVSGSESESEGDFSDEDSMESFSSAGQSSHLDSFAVESDDDGSSTRDNLLDACQSTAKEKQSPADEAGFYEDGDGVVYFLDKFGKEYYQNQEPEDPDEETGFYEDDDGAVYFLDTDGVEHYKDDAQPKQRQFKQKEEELDGSLEESSQEGSEGTSGGDKQGSELGTENIIAIKQLVDAGTRRSVLEAMFSPEQVAAALGPEESTNQSGDLGDRSNESESGSYYSEDTGSKYSRSSNQSSQASEIGDDATYEKKSPSEQAIHGSPKKSGGHDENSNDSSSGRYSSDQEFSGASKSLCSPTSAQASDASGHEKKAQQDKAGERSIEEGVVPESEGSLSDSSYSSGEDSTRRFSASSSDGSDGLVCRDATTRRSQRSNGSSGSENSMDRDLSTPSPNASEKETQQDVAGQRSIEKEIAPKSDGSFSGSNYSGSGSGSGLGSPLSSHSSGSQSHVKLSNKGATTQPDQESIKRMDPQDALQHQKSFSSDEGSDTSSRKSHASGGLKGQIAKRSRSNNLDVSPDKTDPPFAPDEGSESGSDYSSDQSDDYEVNETNAAPGDHFDEISQEPSTMTEDDIQTILSLSKAGTKRIVLEDMFTPEVVESALGKEERQKGSRDGGTKKRNKLARSDSDISLEDLSSVGSDGSQPSKHEGDEQEQGFYQDEDGVTYYVDKNGVEHYPGEEPDTETEVGFYEDDNGVPYFLDDCGIEHYQDETHKPVTKQTNKGKQSKSDQKTHSQPPFKKKEDKLDDSKVLMPLAADEAGFFEDGDGAIYFLDKFGKEHYQNQEAEDPDEESGFYEDDDGVMYFLDKDGEEHYKDDTQPRRRRSNAALPDDYRSKQKLRRRPSKLALPDEYESKQTLMETERTIRDLDKYRNRQKPSKSERRAIRDLDDAGTDRSVLETMFSPKDVAHALDVSSDSDRDDSSDHHGPAGSWDLKSNKSGAAGAANGEAILALSRAGTSRDVLESMFSAHQVASVLDSGPSTGSSPEVGTTKGSSKPEATGEKSDSESCSDHLLSESPTAVKVETEEGSQEPKNKPDLNLVPGSMSSESSHDSSFKTPPSSQMEHSEDESISSTEIGDNDMPKEEDSGSVNKSIDGKELPENEAGFYEDGDGVIYFLDKFGKEHYQNQEAVDPNGESGFFEDDDGVMYFLDTDGVEHYKDDAQPRRRRSDVDLGQKNLVETESATRDHDWQIPSTSFGDDWSGASTAAVKNRKKQEKMLGSDSSEGVLSSADSDENSRQDSEEGSVSSTGAVRKKKVQAKQLTVESSDEDSSSESSDESSSEGSNSTPEDKPQSSKPEIVGGDGKDQDKLGQVQPVHGAAAALPMEAISDDGMSEGSSTAAVRNKKNKAQQAVSDSAEDSSPSVGSDENRSKEMNAFTPGVVNSSLQMQQPAVLSQGEIHQQASMAQQPNILAYISQGEIHQQARMVVPSEKEIPRNYSDMFDEGGVSLDSHPGRAPALEPASTSTVSSLSEPKSSKNRPKNYTNVFGGEGEGGSFGGTGQKEAKDKKRDPPNSQRDADIKFWLEQGTPLTAIENMYGAEDVKRVLRDGADGDASPEKSSAATKRGREKSKPTEGPKSGHVPSQRKEVGGRNTESLGLQRAASQGDAGDRVSDPATSEQGAQSKTKDGKARKIKRAKPPKQPNEPQLSESPTKQRQAELHEKEKQEEITRHRKKVRPQKQKRQDAKVVDTSMDQDAIEQNKKQKKIRPPKQAQRHQPGEIARVRVRDLQAPDTCPLCETLEAKIETLKAALDKMKGWNTSIEERLSDEQTKNAELEGRLKEIDSLKEQNKSLAKENKKLLKATAKIEKQSEKHQEQLVATTEKLNSTVSEKEALNKKLKRVLATSKKQRAAAFNDKKASDSQMQAYKENLKEARQEINRLTEKNESYAGTLSLLAEKGAEVANQLAEANEKNEAASKENTVFATGLDKSLAKQEDLQRTIMSMEKAWKEREGELISRLQNETREKVKAQEQARQLEESLDETGAQVDDLAHERDEWTANISKLENEVSNHKQLLLDANEKLRDATTKNAELQGKAEDSSKRSVLTTAQVRGLEASLEEKMMEITGLHRKVEEKSTEIADLHRNVEALKEDLGRAYEEIWTMEQEQNEMAERVRDLDIRAGKSHATLTEVYGDLDTARAENKELKTSLLRSRSEYEAMREAKELAESSLEATEENIQSFHEILNETKSEYEAMREAKELAESSLKATEANIQSFHEILNETKEEMQHLSSSPSGRKRVQSHSPRGVAQPFPSKRYYTYEDDRMLQRQFATKKRTYPTQSIFR